MLLLADLVIPVSSPPLVDAGVRVAEGKIVEVGPAAELRARNPGDETRVFAGCALLPGFVNTHTHLELSAFRGFTRSRSFGPWMLHLLLARRRLGPLDFEASALWGAYECARCGITSIGDTAYDGVAVARAAGAAGLRGRVYQEVFGLDDAALPGVMDRLEAAVDRLRGECGPLLETGVSPHAPYTVSARLYREAADYARHGGLRLATHVAESPDEVEVLARGTGAIARAYRRAGIRDVGTWAPPRVRPLEYVAGTGALWPDALVIHAVQADAHEIGLLAESGAGVAHCPRSNARLHCGAAPVGEMIAAGIAVGLGTDSLASSESLDMFAEMRAALHTAELRAEPGAGEPRTRGEAEAGNAPEARSQARPPSPVPQGSANTAGAAAVPPSLSYDQVLRMATLEGARALGWGDLTGSLDPGKSADIIAVRLPSGGPLPGRGRPADAAQLRLLESTSGDRPPMAGSPPGDVPLPAVERPQRPEPPSGGACSPGGHQPPGSESLPGILVRTATAADVRMTMVAGKVIFEGGTLPVEVASGYQFARQKLGLR